MLLKKSQGSIVLWILFVLVALFAIYIFLFRISTITGSDGSIFKNQQYHLFEKITYLLRSPKIGDVVLFQRNEASSGDLDYVGLIVKIDKSSEGKLTYTIVTSSNPKNPFLVSKEKIIARGFYPPINSSKNYIDLILRNLLSYKEDQLKKSSGVPDAVINSSTHITGKVYVDTNGNGELDPGEKAVSKYFPSVVLDRIDRQ
jgi:hypothetical protein